MFQQTFLPAHHGARKPLGVMFSFGLQALVLASLILLQLLYVPPVPSVQLKAWLAAPPPPVSHPHVQTAAAELRPAASSRPIFVLRAPVVIPKGINAQSDVQPPSLPDTGVVGTGTESAAAGDLLSAFNGHAAPPPLHTETKAPSRKGVQRVGGSVMAANLVYQVQPVYPPLARSARVEGTVEYTAIIDKTGRVANLQLQHGHPLLVHAAQEAILQWRYKPTTLNGEPVDVMTTITVNFRMSSN